MRRSKRIFIIIGMMLSAAIAIMLRLMWPLERPKPFSSIAELEVGSPWVAEKIRLVFFPTLRTGYDAGGASTTMFVPAGLLPDLRALFEQAQSSTKGSGDASWLAFSRIITIWLQTFSLEDPEKRKEQMENCVAMLYDLQKAQEVSWSVKQRALLLNGYISACLGDHDKARTVLCTIIESGRAEDTVIIAARWHLATSYWKTGSREKANDELKKLYIRFAGDSKYGVLVSNLEMGHD